MDQRACGPASWCRLRRDRWQRASMDKRASMEDAAGRPGVAFDGTAGERASMDKWASMGGRRPGELVSPSPTRLEKGQLWTKGHLWGDAAWRSGVAFDGTAGERASMDKRASMEGRRPATWCRLRRHRWRNGIYG